MARISELTLRDIRCFAGEQRAQLGRVTLLIGENSVGKSTFLGCYKAFATLANMIDLGDENQFNKSPFLMGGFDSIVRSGKSEFAIAGQFEDHFYSEAQYYFCRGDSEHPSVREVDFELSSSGSEPKHINISVLPNANNVLRFRGTDFTFDLDWSEISYISISSWLSRNVRQGFLPFNGDRATFKKRQGPDIGPKELVEFGKFINFFRSEMPLLGSTSFNVEAIEPKLPPREREYVSTPSHLENSETTALLGEIGTYLGLWEEIVVNERQDGRVEVLIKTAAGYHNLIDVGYGIHSLLPLLCAICPSQPEKVFLLQQPEIHVHPVAQAQLAQYMAEGNHSFIIETHSDHFVDWFRICVMEGKLSPEDLSIVYFEPTNDRTKSRIYSLGVDAQGNLQDTPDSYRQFFLRETERLLGFEE